MKSYNLENRRFVIGGVALAIVLVYIIRLFTIQLLSDDFKKNADSNAFLKKIDYPSRGAIYDRNGKLMVYNQQTISNSLHLSYTEIVKCQNKNDSDYHASRNAFEPLYPIEKIESFKCEE